MLKVFVLVNTPQCSVAHYLCYIYFSKPALLTFYKYTQIECMNPPPKKMNIRFKKVFIVEICIRLSSLLRLYGSEVLQCAEQLLRSITCYMLFLPGIQDTR